MVKKRGKPYREESKEAERGRDQKFEYPQNREIKLGTYGNSKLTRAQKRKFREEKPWSESDSSSNSTDSSKETDFVESAGVEAGQETKKKWNRRPKKKKKKNEESTAEESGQKTSKKKHNEIMHPLSFAYKKYRDGGGDDDGGDAGGACAPIGA